MGKVIYRLTLALRSLKRAPLFTAVTLTILTVTGVAVGLGVTIVDSVFLRPLPYAEPSTLAIIMGASHEECDVACPDLLPLEQYKQIEQESRSFASLASFEWRDFLVGGHSDSEHASGAVVDGQFFSMLGASAQLGRTIVRTDDAAGASPVVVLSNGLWRRIFGSDPDLIGKEISVAGRLFTVIGVMPSEFHFPAGTSLWVPANAIAPGLAAGSRFVAAMGRLHPRTTLDQARAELKVIARRSQRPNTIGALRTSISAHAFGEDSRADSPYFALLLGAVGLLVLVAFAALQTLAIVRVLGHRTSMAVRAALGASRAQLLGSALMESAVTTCMSIVLAMTILAWLVSSSPLWLPTSIVEGGLTLRAAVVAFVVVGIVAFAALAFVPATAFIVRATSSAILRTAAGCFSPPRQAVTLRLFAVGIQIGLGVVFLSVAVTLGRTIGHLRGSDLGYDREHLVLAPLDLRDTPLDETERGLSFANDLVSKISSAPGSAAAAVWSVSSPSMMVKPGEAYATIEGGIKELRYGCRNPSDCSFPMMRYGVTKDFFDVTRVHLVAGRPFNSGDQRGTASVAVISQQAAVHWWPGERALGRRFKIGPPTSPFPWLTVVGVAANTQPIDEWGILHGALHPGQFYPLIFQPLSQVELGPSGRPSWTASLLVGVRRGQAAFDPGTTIRMAIRELSSTVAVGKVASMLEVQSGNQLFDQIRLGAWAASLACIVATALTLLSIGGLVAEGIRSRTREFGIRLAIGATPARLRRTATKDAIRLTATAVLSATAAAVLLRYPLARVFFGATDRYKDGILYGTEPHLALTLLIAAAALGFVVGGCAWLATRPLKQLNPGVLLRQE